MSTELRAARVRVPCSTSNLGSGFDTLGLALDRYLRAEFVPGLADLAIERTGTLSDLDPAGGADLLGTAFRRTLEEGGASPAGLLRVHSEIPIARGLGSSAAALVAGWELARAALGHAPDPVAAFRFAHVHEGHGDNAAPCALGGLQAVLPEGGRARAVRLELSGDVGFAYAAPAEGVSTAAARAALPESVPHATAVRSLGRITALVRGFATGDGALLRAGVADELHVPYRVPLIMGAEGAMEAAYDAGAWAVTISGSGSGLIAMGPIDRATAVAEAMRAAFAGEGQAEGCLGFVLHPDHDGVVRED